MDAPFGTSTSWLSILLGVYLLAGGIAAWLRGRLWYDMLDDFDRSPGLVAIAGAVAFAIGATIVTFHNVWTDPAAILVTLAGWIAVIEGLSLLTVPHLWLRLARRLIGAPGAWGTAMMVIGAFLLASALTRGSMPIS